MGAGTGKRELDVASRAGGGEGGLAVVLTMGRNGRVPGGEAGADSPIALGDLGGDVLIALSTVCARKRGEIR